jgi:hypothetical protein
MLLTFQIPPPQICKQLQPVFDRATLTAGSIGGLIFHTPSNASQTCLSVTSAVLSVLVLSIPSFYSHVYTFVYILGYLVTGPTVTYARPFDPYIDNTARFIAADYACTTLRLLRCVARHHREILPHEFHYIIYETAPWSSRPATSWPQRLGVHK